ncbi:hypothetical protein V6N13_108012 [Hibiscus sabdariffa]
MIMDDELKSSRKGNEELGIEAPIIILSNEEETIVILSNEGAGPKESNMGWKAKQAMSNRGPTRSAN